MVGAWWCNREAQRLGVDLEAVPFMERIREYNEVDCRVLMEMLQFLRGGGVSR